MASRLKVGSIMKILEDGDVVWYAHYVHLAPKDGPIIQVYRCTRCVQTGDITTFCDKPFPPIVCGLAAPIKDGHWSIVGYEEPPPFEFPLFLMQGFRQNDGGYLWWTYDGVEQKRLEHGVPPEMRGLETLSGWSAELLGSC